MLEVDAQAGLEGLPLESRLPMEVGIEHQPVGIRIEQGFLEYRVDHRIGGKDRRVHLAHARELAANIAERRARTFLHARAKRCA